MGKKVSATKIKPPSTRREETPVTHPPRDEPPPNPQLSEPTPLAPPMVSLDAMAEFLRLPDPTRNWAAELANFNQVRGQGSVTGASPAVAMSVTSTQPAVHPSSIMPISSTIPQEENPPVEATTSEPAEPSPTHQETEPMEVEAIAAYYDSDPEERAERLRKERQDRDGGSTVEETSVVEPVRQEVARGEIDLNETAKKQGLMTDNEFQAIMDEVNQREVDTAVVAEGLDLASRAAGEGERADEGNRSEGQAERPVGEMVGSQIGEEISESVNPQVEAEESGEHEEADETKTIPEVPNPVAPPVIKPKAVKRKLVLKDNPMAA